MNMISTGAFLTEMDASNKQETLAEKFARVWEKKNSKVARAGGVSLMALSLAACGSDDDTTTTTTTDTTTTVTPTTDAAQTFTLTKDVIDNIVGGSGDDIIIGDNNTITAADQINGGAGNDTLKMYGSLVNGVTTSVETMYYNAIIGDLNVASETFTTIEFDTATTTAAGTDTITVAAGQTVILDSITDGDAADDTNDKGEVDITSASTVTSYAIEVQGVGAAAAADDIEIDIVGSGVTSISIASTTGKNYVGLLNTGAAMKTITVTGDTLLDADENALTAVTTIDASASTGGVLFNTTGSTVDLTFKGGSGDDTLTLGTDFDADDNISGGAGTDTLIIGAAALTAATNAMVKELNTITDVEQVMSNTAAGDGIAIDFSKLTTISSAGAVANTPGANAANAAGDTALTITGATNADTILVGGNIVGGTSATAGNSAGGDAISVATASNTGSDTINILFTAASNVTGGLGQDDNGGNNDAGGDGLAADTIENINITTASATADVTFREGGSADQGTATTSAGEDVRVGANGTITISGAGDVDLGTVVSAAGTSADDLTINGAGMTGVLTVTTGAGNDTITGGSKADSITAGTGTNTITSGGGSDTMVFADGASTSTAMTTITDFTAGAGGDILNFAAGGAVTYEALTGANATAIAADTTLAAALTQAASQLAANEATAFSFGGSTYLLFEDGTNAGAYNAAADVVVLLTGVDTADLHTDNVI